MTKTFMYLLRGLGDDLLSKGMDDLGRILAKLYPDATVEMANWGDWHRIVAEINAKPSGSHLILIGYSMGANEVTGIAEAVPKHPIDLLVMLDPTLWDTMSPLGPNVNMASIWHNGNPLNIVGHANASAAPGFDPKRLIVHQTMDLHSDVDKDALIRNTTLAEVETAHSAAKIADAKLAKLS